MIVACNSIQKAVLQPEFPAVRFVELEGYGISYGETGRGTRFKILLQLRKILTRIKSENRWLTAFLDENKVDALISDNRYGLYHPDIPSVFITHQLQIHSGCGWIANTISQKFLYRIVNRFSACWVPDHKEKNIIAGKLSHPSVLPSVPISYIGPVSRFTRCETATEKRFDLLVIISGPEPQRSLFEKMILKQAMVSDKKIALVRGLPLSSEAHSSSRITVFNHLDVAQLNNLICESEFILCRSGYTTIMDMMKLKKKMIVVPTPGQPEQEYIADYLSKNNYVLKFKQHNFNLQNALQQADNFTFIHIDATMDEYKVVLKDFVDRISSLSLSSTH